MLKHLIIVIVGVYFFYIIYKKIKNIKKGKICDCGCSDCLIKGKCNLK